jgi:hypothetical protein
LRKNIKTFLNKYCLPGGLILGLSLWLPACDGGDNKDSEPDTGTPGQTYTLTLSRDTAWVNTGLKFAPGSIFHITAGEKARGEILTQEEDPIPMSGHGSLIGRVGQAGRPFPVGMEYRVAGNSLNVEETLYLGWNDRDFDPPADSGNAREDLEVKIQVIYTDGAPLLAPADGIWAANTQPNFNWDEINDAAQYKLEVSQFPDFRLLEISNTSTVTTFNLVSVGVSTPSIGGTNTSDTSVTLPEGVHYWRVRAQLNTGRTLAPSYGWTDWSNTFHYGVELGVLAPTAPTILEPKAGDTFTEGETRIFEFTSPPDPSGLVWKHRQVKTACGESPSINSEDPESGEPSPWQVFQGSLDVADPTKSPQYYGYFTSPVLTRGEWLFRVETRDGADAGASRVASTDLQASVGCEEFPEPTTGGYPGGVT